LARSGENPRETDLSAEQIGAQAASRLSRPDGNQGRPQGAECAARAGAQETQRLGFARERNIRSQIDLKVFGMERLKRRTDFRAAATGARAPASAFVVQALRRAESGPPRIGFTVSKQVGNAVERNRVRRRLREIVKLAGASALRSGHDYVLVGRRAALAAKFTAMTRDFDAALHRVHESKRSGREAAGAARTPPLHEAGLLGGKPGAMTSRGKAAKRTGQEH
jgi:ribonuclease P protein component